MEIITLSCGPKNRFLHYFCKRLISKDKKTLLVVELKKGRASDSVIGQIQRYMGYVKEVIAEDNQQVKGVIIALDDDIRIRRALAVTNNIEFYRYQVSFRLFKG